MNEYKCRLMKIVDGNTVEADIELEFDIWTKQKIRLYGVDATNSQTGGAEAVQKEIALLKQCVPREFLLQIMHNKRPRAGRAFGVLHKLDQDGNRININDELIENGAQAKQTK